jgi:hypothetical protein
MATETLTLRMRARGSRSVERDVDRVGRKVRGVGENSVASSGNVGVFTRALTILQTRAAIATVIIGALSLATVAAVPSMLLLAAAALALGAALIPAFAIGAGVMMLFASQANVAGTAANDLKHGLAALKHAFRVAVSPAAAVVMRAIAEAFKILAPVLETMRAPLLVFGKVMAAAMVAVAHGFAAMGPEIRLLIFGLSELVPLAAQGIVPAFEALTQAAIAGLPVLHQLLVWLVAFLLWLPGAVAWMDKFGHSAEAGSVVHEVFRDIAAAALWTADVFSSLAGIAVQVWHDLEPLAVVLGVALLFALRAVRDVLAWVNRNMHFVHGIILPLTSAFIAYKLAVLGAAGAEKLLVASRVAWALGQTLFAVLTLIPAVSGLSDALILLEAATGIAIAPAVALAVASVALTAGLVILYLKVRAVHDAFDALWSLWKFTPMGLMIQAWQRLITFVASVPGRIRGITFDGIWDGLKTGLVDVLNWCIGKINWLIRAANHLPGVNIGQIDPIGDDRPTGRGNSVEAIARGVRGGAGPTGGTRNRPVHVPVGLGGDLVLPVSVLMPNGDVLARTTVRAGKKKKSTR